MSRRVLALVPKALGLLITAGMLRRIFAPKAPGRNAAYADNQPHDSHLDIRDAGPEAMRDPPSREWTETDEDGDESFPASDPPGGY